MEDEVYKLLDELEIKYEKIEHPPLFSGSDSEKYNIKIDALDCKNLFLRNNKKTQYYLVCLPVKKRANLKELQEKLQETRLSFGNEQTLEEKLGIKSGSVSIFNVINLTDKNLIFILDKDMLEADRVAFHPNVNTASVMFEPKNLSKILEHFNAKYKFIKI